MDIFMKSTDITVLFAKISNAFKITISGEECGLVEHKAMACNYRKFILKFKSKEDIEKLGLVFEFEEFVFICEYLEKEKNNLCINYFCIPKEKFKKEFLQVFSGINMKSLIEKTKIVKSNYSVGYLDTLKMILLKSWEVKVKDNNLEVILTLSKKKYTKYVYDIVKLNVETVIFFVQGYAVGYSTMDKIILECDKLKEVHYNHILFSLE